MLFLTLIPTCAKLSPMAKKPPAVSPGIDPNQKLTKVERRPIEVRQEPLPAKPTERDIAWWLEPVKPSKPGRFIAPSVAPRAEEILVTQTQEQFDKLQTAVDAVEVNKGFDQADNTKSAYAYEWRTFVKWCIDRGQSPIPASPATVRAYIADISANERVRVLKGTKGARVEKRLPPRRPSGLWVALSAIAWFHKKYDRPSPHMDALVQDELERIERRVGIAPAQKSPLTVPHLDEIVALLEEERKKPKGRDAVERKAAVRRAIRNKAIVLLGFAGAFRRSELALLELDEVTFRPEGLDAAVSKSKADQKGEGMIKAIISGEKPHRCPKLATEEWLSVMSTPSQKIATGPVFREVDRLNRLVQNVGATFKGLSGDEVALIVKRYVEKIGLNPAMYSGHSLRSGLITAAAQEGRSVYEIMAMTGHKNPATVYVYIRFAQRFENSAARGLL